MTVTDGTAGAPVTATRSPALSAEEQAVAKRLSGGFGWPTVLLTATLLGVELGVVALWYTVHHDATHKAISGRNPKLTGIENLCGTIAGYAIQLDFSTRRLPPGRTPHPARAARRRLERGCVGSPRSAWRCSS